MPYLGVRYSLSDGVILGVVGSTSREDLLMNTTPGVDGLVEVPSTHPVCISQRRYIVRDGSIQEKTHVEILPSKLTFVADGVDECVVTLTGLTHPVTVKTGVGAPVTVGPADPVLILTADETTSFYIELEDTDHYADPITVRAR